MTPYIPLAMFPDISPVPGMVSTSNNCGNNILKHHHHQHHHQQPQQLSPTSSGPYNMKPVSPYGPDLRIPLFEDCASGDLGLSEFGVGGMRDNGEIYSEPDLIVGRGGSPPEFRVQGSEFRLRHFIHSPNLQLEGMGYDQDEGRPDPYSPMCMVPLPGSLMEHGFIRRRNERERERVRCVNEGYDRLKDHLPMGNKSKRMSKVDTLRGAIDYIRELEDLLRDTDNDRSDKTIQDFPSDRYRSHLRHGSSSASDSSEFSVS